MAYTHCLEETCTQQCGVGLWVDTRFVVRNDHVSYVSYASMPVLLSKLMNHVRIIVALHMATCVLYLANNIVESMCDVVFALFSYSPSTANT